MHSKRSHNRPATEARRGAEEENEKRNNFSCGGNDDRLLVVLDPCNGERKDPVVLS